MKASYWAKGDKMDQNNNSEREGAPVMSARRAAVKMLLLVCKDGIFSTEAKERVLSAITDKRERALAICLLDGTLERLWEIDYIINQFSKTPVNEMKPVIAAILRMSVYQIRFMDKIPVSAACNEAVNLTKKNGFLGLAGFVNGVLRSIARAEHITYPDEKKDAVFSMSVKYSMPTTIVELICGQYGREVAERIFYGFYERREYLTTRCITSTISVEELISEWKKDGLSAEKGTLSPNAVLVAGRDNPTELRGFSEGWFYVQDESSMTVAENALLEGNETVLDMCAAPGGKTVDAADFLKKKGGRVISRDLTEDKTDKIIENIKRCGLNNVKVQKKDATVFIPEDENAYDTVFADVPCSGLGIINRKPDIKYFFRKENLDSLISLQKEILKNAVRYVKPGGILMFSTCTVNKEENEGGTAFCESLGMTKEWAVQYLPGKDRSDGFYVARLRKKK